jgi:hypothetical protein
MRIERSQVLEAAPYQRTEKRRGHANGFKGKMVSRRLGELAFGVAAGAWKRGILSIRAGARTAQ